MYFDFFILLNHNRLTALSSQKTFEQQLRLLLSVSDLWVSWYQRNDNMPPAISSAPSWTRRWRSPTVPSRLHLCSRKHLFTKYRCSGTTIFFLISGLSESADAGYRPKKSDTSWSIWWFPLRRSLLSLIVHLCEIYPPWNILPSADHFWTDNRTGWTRHRKLLLFTRRLPQNLYTSTTKFQKRPDNDQDWNLP